VQVRLLGGETSRRRGTFLERLVGAANIQPASGSETAIVASWPGGKPFPINAERRYEQLRQRTIRRWAAGLIFVDGVSTS